MFPFLAVLLCTIGALVLILVISVVHSRATAERFMESQVTQRLELAKESSDIMESVSDELQARREKVKQEIERRRRELANIEDHIARMNQEMEQLRKKAEAIDAAADLDETEQQNTDQRLAEVREEIEKKKRELAEEIEKQKKRKPAFAILPYKGPNGTSRRPVYLECRKEGVIIQPEGVLISFTDLRPPHGPGNPLDAALRVLRTTYQEKDATFGLTTPPYPLLIVRPDGIHTYALARAAMSGWDDQFGYELIDEEMELTFPPGAPQLANDLKTALDMAKRRQEALVASLPRQYVRSREMVNNEDGDSLFGDASNSRTGSSGSNDWGDEPGTDRSGVTISEDNNRWKMVQELQQGQVVAEGDTGQAAAVLRLREVTILSAEPHSRTAHQLCPQELQVPAHSAPRTCRVPTKPFKANHQRHYKACQGEVHRQEPPREHKVLLDPMQVALRRRFLELRALELRALELRGPTVHQMARRRTPIAERMLFQAGPPTA
jgi:TolA-binding protein